MNVNFGLFPPLGRVKKVDRPGAYCARALSDLESWLNLSKAAA
jgi:folate-dependent tRNA-U54 methylase TrmFO/GidA